MARSESDGSSMLTDAGFDYVNKEGTARIRIGDGSLPAEVGPSDGGARVTATLTFDRGSAGTRRSR